jgi:hypothetical protein
MFQTETRTTPKLQLVAGGKERRERQLKGAHAMNTNMNEYRFAEYPSNSSVASGVTLLVSAWFLVAAGAIIADPASPYTQRPAAVAQVAAPAPAVVAAATPAAYFTIKVEAKRLKV